MPAMAWPNGTSRPVASRMMAATGSARAAIAAIRAGPAIASQAAGIQRAYRPSIASTWSMAALVRSAEWRARSSAGPAAIRRAMMSARRRARPVAPAVKARWSAANCKVARASARAAKPASASQGRGAWVRAAASQSARQKAWAAAAAMPEKPRIATGMASRAPDRVCWRAQARAAFFVSCMIAFILQAGAVRWP
jgi:hypothetical protein